MDAWAGVGSACRAADRVGVAALSGGSRPRRAEVASTGARLPGPEPYTRGVAIGPAAVLAVLVGGFHAALYLFLRGRGGWQIPAVVMAAALGAWAGDATGGRLGVDPIRIGDFHVIAASVVAWAAIIFVVVLSVLGPSDRQDQVR